MIPVTTFANEDHAIEIANGTDLVLDGCVFTSDYDRVLRVAETLGEVSLRDSLSDSVRLNATAGLGWIVGECPSIAVETVDDVVTLFDADNAKFRKTRSRGTWLP